MRVLVACEYSGRVRDAFSALGHEAWSCDLLPSETPGKHIQADVLPILSDGWDLIVGHPPCTRLCNSGVRWLAERNLWGELDEACAFFSAFLAADCPRIAVENPVMHKHARERIGVEATQFVQPHWFGDNESKRTGLWLKGLPPLVRTHFMLPPYGQSVHHASPGKDRWRVRSRTFPGLAAAMASQWGQTTEYQHGTTERFGVGIPHMEKVEAESGGGGRERVA